MQDFFQLWGKTCSQIDQSIFDDVPKHRHFKDQSCFSFSDPFFVIVDHIARQMSFPDETTEIVLTVSNGPTNEYRYIHLLDRWLTLPISVGMIISLIPSNQKSDNWQIMDDDQQFYQNKFAIYINNSSKGLILFPHYLFKISSFSSYRNCPRSVFFRETHMFNNPTLFSLFGKFTTLTLQQYVMNKCNGNDILAADIVDQLRRNYIIQLYYISKTQNDNKVNAIKSVNEFDSLIEKVAGTIDSKHHVLMTIPNTKRIYIESKAFPGNGVNAYISDQAIWSFTYGLVGRPNCVVEIEEEEVSVDETVNSVVTSPQVEESTGVVNTEQEIKTHIVPIEVIGTVGKTNIDALKNGHILSVSAQLCLLSEIYGESQTKHGFIWYVGSNQRYWVQPREDRENSTVRLIRNVIACSIANDVAPPKQVSSDCDLCISRTVCALYDRMKDHREYIKKTSDDIEDVQPLPESLQDFSKNMSRIFYQRYHRQIFKDAMSSMWSCVRITTSDIAERERKGYALSNLSILKIESIKTLKHSTEIFHLTLGMDFPGKQYSTCLNRLDGVIITKNGQMPILAFGNVDEIKVNYIVVSTYEKNFNVGEVITIDFFTPNQWFASDNEILDNLLINPSYSHMKGYIINGIPPLFRFTRPQFISSGLNLRQSEAVSRGLSATNYFLINAPHGTGRIVVGLRIVHALINMKSSVKILIAPFYYSTINKLCEGLEVLGIQYVVGGKIERIHEKYQKRHEDVLFASCKSIYDTDQIDRMINVYIVPSSAKQFDVLFEHIYDMVIMYESSRLPLLRSIPSLNSNCPFILFGDTVLDNEIDSLFTHFQRINALQVFNLWEMYNCEPSIVTTARACWGTELISVSRHASVILKPLKIFEDRQLRKFLSSILTMDKPIVFLNISVDDIKMIVNPSILIIIAASLLYCKDEKLNVIADEYLQPLISSSLFICQTDGKRVFSRYVEHLQKSVSQVKYYGQSSIMSKRKDVMICMIGNTPDSKSLTMCLGMTRRKLIFIGNKNIVYNSPLWATVLNTIPEEWIIDFPLMYVENEVSPLLALNSVFSY